MLSQPFTMLAESTEQTYTLWQTVANVQRLHFCNLNISEWSSFLILEMGFCNALELHNHEFYVLHSHKYLSKAFNLFFFVSRRKKTSNRDISLSEHMHTIFHISKMPLLMFAHSFGASIYFVPYISASCSKGYWFFFHSQFQWSFERYTIPSKWPESIGLTGGESNSLEF